MTAPRIDAHQHFWHYQPAEFGWIDDTMAALRRDFLPPDLQPLLRASGLQRCIAVQARESVVETDFLLGMAAAHPWIAGVVGWVDLRSPAVPDQLRRLAGHRALCGVRHIVQQEPDPRFVLGEAFQAGIAELAHHQLAYDLLLYPHQLPAASELARRFPRQRFVLDHLAKPRIAARQRADWERDLRALAACANVDCKLSGMVTEAHWTDWRPADLRPYYQVALDAFGPDRLLFGSDWPVCLVAARYQQWLEVVAGWLADLDAGQQEAVMGGNAVRAYRLGPELPEHQPSGR